MRQFTIERPRKVVQNKFDLVILTGQRARDLSSGAKPLLDGCSGDTSVTIALQEISENVLNIEELRRLVIRRHQLNVVDFGYAPDANSIEQSAKKESNHENIEASDIFFGDDNIESDN